MALLTNSPRGTQDRLPKDSYKYRFIETVALETAALFGFKELETPTFEHTELFARSVGDTTDVVQKEMYTFEDKGGRSVTLKPEGTAGAVRACVQNGLLGDALPLKVCYSTSCFRYEKPQAGRLREFHQFGVEMFGSKSPAADADVIMLAKEIFTVLGITDLELKINSIGCPECRTEYYKALKEYFEARKESLCETCLSRLETNPMRILDCKCPECKQIGKDAPVVLDYICDDCREHFEGVKARLEAMGVNYTVNPKIVRGLDYYTKTVFEFVSKAIGAQGTVCGGGRYDGLVSHMGGQSVPGLGFGMGIERIMLVMNSLNIDFPQPRELELYIASMGEKANIVAGRMANELRAEGFYVDFDTVNRSLKAQMKYADKVHARFSMVLGDNELETGRAALKNMETGETRDIEFEKELTDILYTAGIERAAGGLDGELSDIFATMESLKEKDV